MGFQFGNQIFPATNNFDFTNQDLANIWFVLFNAFGGGGANNLAPVRKFAFSVGGVIQAPGAGNNVAFDLSFINTIFSTGDKILLSCTSMIFDIEQQVQQPNQINGFVQFCTTARNSLLWFVPTGPYEPGDIGHIVLDQGVQYQENTNEIDNQWYTNAHLPLPECPFVIPMATPAIDISVDNQAEYVLFNQQAPACVIQVELLNPQ